MNQIEELIAKIIELRDNINDYIRLEVIEDEAFICDMNSENQLFEKGITREGIKINSYVPYSKNTIAVKIAKGQPTNRVTLRDTGEFHASFVVYADDTKFFIDAKDWKTNKLGEKYGEEIFGLTDENINELIWEYIYPALMNKVRNL